jgi:hypothetical protein
MGANYLYYITTKSKHIAIAGWAYQNSYGRIFIKISKTPIEKI